LKAYIYYILKRRFKINGVINLVGELLAAFKAAALKDEASSMSCISLHEAMLSFALTLVRLISSFWHKTVNPIFLILANIWYIIPQFSTEIKKFSTRCTGLSQNRGKVLPCYFF